MAESTLLDITFRQVSTDDLPLLSEWLARPHWREWWGDPETELGYIKDMLEGQDSTEPYIFEVGAASAGYIQMWRIKDARDEPWITSDPWVADLPDNAVGVDLSIADPENLSRGLGTIVLSEFVAKLRRQGETYIIIDPDPRNLRAVRAYHKAGFQPINELKGRTGDSLIMRHIEDQII